MNYICLAIAILCEVAATTALKSSTSFTRLGPSLVVVVGYAGAFYFMSLCLRTMKIGVVYAIWAGVGIVLITIAGVIFYGQKIDLAGIVGIGLIAAGIVVLNGFSQVVVH